MTTRPARRIAAALALALISVGAHAAGAAELIAQYQRSLPGELHRSVVDSLKDGPSARFRGQFLSENDPDDFPLVTSLCGEVNAKNSYGAYAGFHRFVATSSGLIIFEHGDEAAFRSIWPVWCLRPLPIQLGFR